jgi:hypothetical protein
MHCVRRLVPVAGNVVQIQLDDRPEVVGYPRRVPVGNQPVSIANNCRRTKRRSVCKGMNLDNLHGITYQTDLAEDDPMHQ